MLADMPSALDRFHIVLVEPAESLNIGAVARAMRNLGFSHLHLVAPRGYDRERAGVTARQAAVLLDTLTVHARFPDALAPFEDVVGLALRAGENPATYTTLPAWARALPGREPRTTALVFGPEDDDLRKEHLEQCRRVVRIPSAAAFPSFNLAQSVLLTLYEVAQSLGGEAAPPAVDDSAPTWNDYFQLDRHVDGVMQRTGFVRPGSPEPVPSTVRALWRRLDLNRREMGILMALFSRIAVALEQKNTPPP
jgi:TrmH family RNA methyltransferase